MYRRRYPQSHDRIVVLENGFDEEVFRSAEAQVPEVTSIHPGAITLLHSGVVYPQERDPAPLMEALGRVKSECRVPPGTLRVRFRAPGSVELILELAKANGVSDMVEVLPSISYQAALQEMRSADALLLMQGADCNEQIPAKAYEYLRAGQPILCLSDPAGDTARLMNQYCVTDVVRLDDATAIAASVTDLHARLSQGGSWRRNMTDVCSASRQARTSELARLLAMT